MHSFPPIYSFYRIKYKLVNGSGDFFFLIESTTSGQQIDRLSISSIQIDVVVLMWKQTEMPHNLDVCRKFGETMFATEIICIFSFRK